MRGAERNVFRSGSSAGSEIRHLHLDRLWLDEGARPHLIQQLALGDQPAGVLHQVAQDLKALSTGCAHPSQLHWSA